MGSIAGTIYTKLYSKICGAKSNVNISHFQYLATYKLVNGMKNILVDITTKNVLDLGCGTKPYQKLFSNIEKYTGIDLYQSGVVDYVFQLPFDNEAFDFVISSQVFEHVDNLYLLHEINRVMKKDSYFLISVPFLYHIHDKHDYRRFAESGLSKLLLEHNFSDIRIIQEGGIGSTVGILVLSFIESTMNKNRLTRITKAMLLPVWLIASLVINILGVFIDELDNTNCYYNNLVAVCKKS